MIFGLKIVFYNEEKKIFVIFMVVGGYIYFLFEIKSKLWVVGKIKSSIYNILEIIINIFLLKKKRLCKFIKDDLCFCFGFCELFENFFLCSVNVILVYL